MLSCPTWLRSGRCRPSGRRALVRRLPSEPTASTEWSDAAPTCSSSGRVAALFERVEDEVEAVLERGSEVVADFGDVPGDDFGEVGKLLRERGGLPLLRELGELPDLLLRDGCALLGAVEREALLLEGEAVDVGVLDGVGLDGHLDREAGFSKATEDGVVESE